MSEWQVQIECAGKTVWYFTKQRGPWAAPFPTAR